MADGVLFDEADDTVLEIVLSSDEEYQGDVGGLTAEERRARRQGLAARFFPGVEAGALFAFGLSLVGLFSAATVEQFFLNRADVAFSTSSDGSSFNGSGKESATIDMFRTYRDMTRGKSLALGIFALVACGLAVLVLSRWQPARHARWARPVAQTALCLGLLGLVFAVLMYTGIVSGLPSPANSTPEQIIKSRG